MIDKPLTSHQKAYADRWLQYGGDIKAIAKSLNQDREASGQGKITPEQVRQNIARLKTLGLLPEPNQRRVAIAQELSKRKGSIDCIPGDVLIVAEELGMDPRHFRSSWPAKAAPDPTAPDCPYCERSGRVRRRTNPDHSNRWYCLFCSRYFSLLRPKPASPAGDARSVPEHIANIRNVFAIKMADLAAILGASRYTMYAWLHGRTKEPRALERIWQLSGAADEFRKADIERLDKLLHRPVLDGCSLLDILMAGKDPLVVLPILKAIADKEANARLEAKGSGKFRRSLGDVLDESSVPIARKN